MKTGTLLNEVNPVSGIRESIWAETQKTVRKTIHRTVGIFLTLMKEILEVQNEIFHILFPCGFCLMQAQRKEKRGRCALTCTCTHTCLHEA